MFATSLTMYSFAKIQIKKSEFEKKDPKKSTKLSSLLIGFQFDKVFRRRVDVVWGGFGGYFDEIWMMWGRDM